MSSISCHILLIRGPGYFLFHFQCPFQVTAVYSRAKNVYLLINNPGWHLSTMLLIKIITAIKLCIVRTVHEQ